MKTAELIIKDGVRCGQTMVEMRDGVRLNTFVYLPDDQIGTYPVIMQRSPYGITSPQGSDVFNPLLGWNPDPQLPMAGALLRGWRALVDRGYAVVFQDCRGRHGSEGEDTVYGNDANDGFDTLEWISRQSWSNQKVGIAGSSAAATTTYAAVSQNHPSVKAFFAQVGGASIYNDIIYEGGSIELERLWLWVAENIPGLSKTHVAQAKKLSGLDAKGYSELVQKAQSRFKRLENVFIEQTPLIESSDWMHLPLKAYPEFSQVQPYIDEIIGHPLPDEFRERHNFRKSINIPGFHATTWYDIFFPSVIAAFRDAQDRVGNQRLWIGPNSHYSIYANNFWPRDPFFEWFDYWLKEVDTKISDEPPVYFSPCSWTRNWKEYQPVDWVHADQWPPNTAEIVVLHLQVDGGLSRTPSAPGVLTFDYDPCYPVPTRGGRNMRIPAGQQKQNDLQMLPNYGLSYTGDELECDITIAGAVTVRLTITSNRPDTDFVAKLNEVRPDGSAHLILDGVVRAMHRNGKSEPLEESKSYEINIALGEIYHTFRKGCRLQVDINSSNFPRRIRNTNSGHKDLSQDGPDDIYVAHNSVCHGPEAIACIELPVLSAG